MKRSIPFLLILTALTGCRPSEATGPSAEPAPVAVSTGQVTMTARPQTLGISGVVRPEARATISAKIMGIIQVADLAVGAKVTKGDVLVRIDAGEYSARLAQASAAQAQAERNLARERELEAKGAAAVESVRDATDQLHLVQATLQEAEAMRAYLEVAAPFTGVVTGDYVNAGDLATPGLPLFELEGMTGLRAEIQVPESLSEPPEGTVIHVELDGRTVAGNIVELSPAADSQSRTRLAKIALPDSTQARSGQYVRALWPHGETAVMTIPANALTRFGQMERVYVVAGNRAQLRLVKTGAIYDDRVQILTGLETGETVVLAPPATLRDGSPLKLNP